MANFKINPETIRQAAKKLREASGKYDGEKTTLDTTLQPLCLERVTCRVTQVINTQIARMQAQADRAHVSTHNGSTQLLRFLAQAGGQDNIDAQKVSAAFGVADVIREAGKVVAEGLVGGSDSAPEAGVDDVFAVPSSEVEEAPMSSWKADGHNIEVLCQVVESSAGDAGGLWDSLSRISPSGGHKGVSDAQTLLGDQESETLDALKTKLTEFTGWDSKHDADITILANTILTALTNFKTFEKSLPRYEDIIDHKNKAQDYKYRAMMEPDPQTRQTYRASANEEIKALQALVKQGRAAWSTYVNNSIPPNEALPTPEVAPQISTLAPEPAPKQKHSEDSGATLASDNASPTGGLAAGNPAAGATNSSAPATQDTSEDHDSGEHEPQHAQTPAAAPAGGGAPAAAGGGAPAAAGGGAPSGGESDSDGDSDDKDDRDDKDDKKDDHAASTHAAAALNEKHHPGGTAGGGAGGGAGSSGGSPLSRGATPSPTGAQPATSPAAASANAGQSGAQTGPGGAMGGAPRGNPGGSGEKKHQNRFIDKKKLHWDEDFKDVFDTPIVNDGAPPAPPEAYNPNPDNQNPDNPNPKPNPARRPSFRRPPNNDSGN